MSSGKTVLAVLAGVGAGVALGYYLSSSNGRKLKSKLTKAITDASDDIKAKLMDEFDELKSKASDMKDKGASLKDKILYAMRDMKDDTKQRILDYMNKMQAEGNHTVDDAKKTVKQS